MSFLRDKIVFQGASKITWIRFGFICWFLFIAFVFVVPEVVSFLASSFSHSQVFPREDVILSGIFSLFLIGVLSFYYFTRGKGSTITKHSLPKFLFCYFSFLFFFSAVHLNVLERTTAIVSIISLGWALKGAVFSKWVLLSLVFVFIGFYVFYHLLEKTKKLGKQCLPSLISCYFSFFIIFSMVHFDLLERTKAIVSSIALPRISLEVILKGAVFSKWILYSFIFGCVGFCVFYYLLEKTKKLGKQCLPSLISCYFTFFIIFSMVHFDLLEKTKTISNVFSLPTISTESFVEGVIFVKMILWSILFILGCYVLRYIGYPIIRSFVLSKGKALWNFFRRSIVSLSSRVRKHSIRYFFYCYFLFFAGFINLQLNLWDRCKITMNSWISSFSFPTINPENFVKGSVFLKLFLGSFLLGIVGYFVLNKIYYLSEQTKKYKKFSLFSLFSIYSALIVIQFVPFASYLSWISIHFPYAFQITDIYAVQVVFYPFFKLFDSYSGLDRILFASILSSLIILFGWMIYSVYRNRRFKQSYLTAVVVIGCCSFTLYALYHIKPAVPLLTAQVQEEVQIPTVKTEAAGMMQPISSSSLKSSLQSLLQSAAPSEPATQKLAFFETPSAPKKEETVKTWFPVPKRMVLSHNSGFGDHGGIGFGNDYSTLGFFLAPDYVIGSFYPLVDLRAHRFDNDTYAANVGIGARYIPPSNSFCEMLGFNVFYDWRQGFISQYNQFGVGFEVLGRRWDFRANGYFPVGAKSFKYTCVFDNYAGGYVITNERKETTTYGFNAEVGWLAVASENFLLYAAAGPYYLTTKSNCFNFDVICGGRIRVRPQYKDYIALDVSFSHDSVFNTVWETVFIVSLPLYQIKNQNERPCRLTDRQIYQPIERLDTMSLGTRSCWTQNY